MGCQDHTGRPRVLGPGGRTRRGPEAPAEGALLGRGRFGGPPKSVDTVEGPYAPGPTNALSVATLAVRRGLGGGCAMGAADRCVAKKRREDGAEKEMWMKG